MKVAMVNTARTLGGAAGMASSLAVAVNNVQKGVSTTLFHSEDRQRSETFYGLKKTGARPLSALLTRLGATRRTADLGLARELSEIIENFDVLHVHNLHGYYVDYRALMKAWNERPLVWTWHDMWGATGRCAAVYECTLWQSGCQQCPSPKGYPATWVDRARQEFLDKQSIFLRNPNLYIVSPSQWLAQIAISRGFRPDRVRVIPNPMDLDKCNPIPKDAARKQLGLPLDKFVALFVASDCGNKRKGYEDFAHAVEQASVLGLALGKAPAKPAAGIRHLGRTTDSQLINLCYSASDVLVMPSYADNYPNTVIEAIANGTPVIGYDVGGVASQLDNSFCRVVTKGDQNGLTLSLRSLRDQGGKTPQIAAELSAIALERWHPAVVAEQYIQVYQTANMRRENEY